MLQILKQPRSDKMRKYIIPDKILQQSTMNNFSEEIAHLCQTFNIYGISNLSLMRCIAVYPRAQTNTQYLKAIVCVCLANTFFFLSYLYANQTQIRGIQSAMIRGFTILVGGYLMCVRNRQFTTFQEKQSFAIVLRRNLLVSCNNWMVGISQFVLPLPIVYSITVSGPIFVFIFDYYMNGIAINYKQLIGIIVGVSGLLLTINGRVLITYFDPSFNSETQFQHYYTTNPIVMVIIAFLLCLTNISWGYAQVITKQLKGLNSFQISYHCGIVLTLMSGVGYCCIGQYKFTTEKLLIGMIFMGLPALASMHFLLIGIKMVKNTGILTMFGFINVVWGYLMSVYVYNQSQNAICIVGVLMIMAGLFNATYFKNQ